MEGGREGGRRSTTDTDNTGMKEGGGEGGRTMVRREEEDGSEKG